MLKDCITPLFADTEQLKELFKVEQPEMEQAEKAVEEWMNEFYIPRISDTIERWEDDYALDHDTGLTLEQRRARIFAKKQQRRVPKKRGYRAGYQIPSGCKTCYVDGK